MLLAFSRQAHELIALERCQEIVHNKNVRLLMYQREAWVLQIDVVKGTLRTIA